MLDENKNPIFLLSQSDIGAGKRGAALGPQAVIDELMSLGMVIPDILSIDKRSFESAHIEHAFGKHIEDIIIAMNALNDKVVQIISQKRFPFIFSGDHSNAIGGLSGLKNANPDKRIGVIWVDAHADLHSPYTTPSGNLHGMPLAALAGLDNIDCKKNEVDAELLNVWNRLKALGPQQISPKFDIKDLVLIDVRDAEKEEWHIINKAGVHAYDPDSIRGKGIEQVLVEALQALAHCDLIYASFDADSLDPSISTGTGTTFPNGLNIEQAKIIFKTLLNQPNLGAFEVTEVNPSLDTNGNAMAKVIAELVHYGLTH